LIFVLPFPFSAFACLDNSISVNADLARRRAWIFAFNAPHCLTATLTTLTAISA
jgi:hypothetical protein